MLQTNIISPVVESVPQWSHTATDIENDEATGVLLALGEAVEQRDSLTAGHCTRLANMSVALGRALGLGDVELLALHRGGFLHDVGKVGIPDSILFKPGKLSEDEWVIMRTHTIRGEDICRRVTVLGPVLPLIRSHHERWDGSGYPDGLRGDQIPLLARVLQLVDIYDALTSSRPYKPAFSGQHACEILRDETKKGWRDPRLVETFLSIHHTMSLSALGQRIAAD